MALTRLLTQLSFVGLLALLAAIGYHHATTDSASVLRLPLTQPLSTTEHLPRSITQPLLQIFAHKIVVRQVPQNLSMCLHAPDHLTVQSSLSDSVTRVVLVQYLEQLLGSIRSSHLYRATVGLNITLRLIYEAEAHRTANPSLVFRSILHELAVLRHITRVHVVTEVYQHVQLSTNMTKAASQASVITKMDLIRFLHAPELRSSGATQEYGNRKIVLSTIIPASGSRVYLVKEEGDCIQGHFCDDQELLTGFWSPPQDSFIVVNANLDKILLSSQLAHEFGSYTLLHLQCLLGIDADFINILPISTSEDTDCVANFESSHWKWVALRLAWIIDGYVSALRNLDTTRELMENGVHRATSEYVVNLYSKSVNLLVTSLQLLQMHNHPNVTSEVASSVFEEIHEAIQNAYEISQQLISDPTVLPMDYFPFDQLFSVFGPLWLPLIFPLVYGTANEMKRYNEKLKSK